MSVSGDPRRLGLRLLPIADGHANRFIETGFKKAVPIDCNYDTQKALKMKAGGNRVWPAVLISARDGQ